MSSSIARDIRQQPFYWIERDFLPRFGATIGPYAIAVYNALIFRSDRAGRAFPGLADIADLTGIRSKNTIRKALDTLSNAGLISVNKRFNGIRYDSNEYYILPISGSQNEPGVVHEMNQGGSLDEPGVVHEMNQGGSLDDTYLQSLNNNHLNNNQLTTSSSMQPLAAAAKSLLTANGINIQNFNGQTENLAAWIVYALTQPRLKNPIGYALTRIKQGEVADPVFQEIVQIDMAWGDLPKDAHYESQYRLGIQGVPVYTELESVSDDAIQILEKLWEVQQ